MALSQDKIDLIIALVKKGGMSNRAIALEVGCGNKVVGQIIKKYDVQKDTIATLVNDEVDTIIKQDEIKATKATMNETEKAIYNEAFLSEMSARNAHLSLNHKILHKLNQLVDTGTKDIKVNAGDGMERIEPIALNGKDYYDVAKAGQTASDNLSLTPRHSQQAVNVNLQNNISAEQASEVQTDTPAQLSEVLSERPENSEQAQIRYDNAMKKRRGEI